MLRRPDGLPIHADTDFCICGTVIPNKLLPEGPFGDHLGYYSLQHDFPVLASSTSIHRDGAIWPFTVVGRPPQEDTIFGQLIHELTGPAIPDRAARRPRASTPSTPPACIRCCWRSAANATGPSPNRSGRRNCSRKPTRSSARANCRSQSSC